MGCGASNSNSAVSQATPGGHVRSPGTPMASRPITAPTRCHNGAPITQGELNNRRAEFWATRTEGNQQMWQSIRSVAEALLENDVALANAIVEASNLITPQGSLEVVFDERGGQYKVPQYCYSNPVELTNAPYGNGTADNSVVIASEISGGSGAPKQQQQQLSSSTRASSAGGSPIQLRVRINPGDYNLVVSSDTLSTILQVKHQIAAVAAQELSTIFCDEHASSSKKGSRQLINSDRQRIIYLGKQLPDQLRVVDAKFDDTKVVQVFLKPLK